MPLTTALALLSLVPTIIALIQEGSDRAVATAGGLLVIGCAAIAAQAHWGALDRFISGGIATAILAVMALLGLVLAVKLSNRVTGTLAATGTSLLLLIRLGAIG